jgi:hypothetical protein
MAMTIVEGGWLSAPCFSIWHDFTIFTFQCISIHAILPLQASSAAFLRPGTLRLAKACASNAHGPCEILRFATMPGSKPSQWFGVPSMFKLRNYSLVILCPVWIEAHHRISWNSSFSFLPWRLARMYRGRTDECYNELKMTSHRGHRSIAWFYTIIHRSNNKTKEFKSFDVSLGNSKAWLWLIEDQPQSCFDDS